MSTDDYQSDHEMDWHPMPTGVDYYSDLRNAAANGPGEERDALDEIDRLRRTAANWRKAYDLRGNEIEHLRAEVRSLRRRNEALSARDVEGDAEAFAWWRSQQ